MIELIFNSLGLFAILVQFAVLLDHFLTKKEIT